MAEVYRARMASPDGAKPRTVALKRLGARWKTQPNVVDMFTTEADVGSLLNHRNVLRVYESGFVDGEPYIAMEFLSGFDLRRLLHARRKTRVPFPTEIAVAVAEQVLRALAYVHEARSAAGEAMGMIHRDVTPENIFVTAQGEVKLLDFGVARLALLSRTHTPLELHGKVRYMPPEVLKGDTETQALDLWSLAAVLYEMVTLTPPYGFVSEDDLLSRPDRHIAEASELVPAVHEGLSAVLNRALHRDAGKRYPDALRFWHELSLLRRGLSVRSDTRVVGRFVCEVMGVEAQTSQKPRDTEVVDPSQLEAVLTDFEQSMTRRIELVQRRRSIRLYTVGAAFAAVLGIVAALFFPINRTSTGLTAEVSSRGGLGVTLPGADRPSNFSRRQDESLEVVIDNAGLLATHGRLREAMASYERALELEADSLEARLGVAEMSFRLQDYPRTGTFLEGILNDYPDEPRALLLNASLLRQVGHPVDAKAAFEEVVAAAPNSAQAAIAVATLERWERIIAAVQHVSSAYTKALASDAAASGASNAVETGSEDDDVAEPVDSNAEEPAELE